jgi:PAS domain S-box-containing protein
VTAPVAALFDLTPEQMVGRTWRELGSLPEAMRPLEYAHTRVAATGQELRSEISYPHLGRSFEYSTAPVLSREGEVDGTLTTMVEITDRKIAEGELASCRKRFRSLLEESPIAIALADRGLLEYVNPRLLKVFGYDDLDELRGRPYIELLAPEERARGDEAGRRIFLGLPEPTENEFVGLRKDGTRFPFHVAVSRIWQDEEAITIAFVIDISERKKAEDALRKSETFLRGIMDNSTDIIFIKDLEGRLIMANRVFYWLVGRRPEEALGRKVIDFGDADFALLAEVEDQRVMSTGAASTFEHRVYTPQGGRDFQTTVAPYRDGEGRIVGFLAVARDITERMTLEKELEEARSGTELYIDLLTHDITNYNTAAMGYLQLAQLRLDLNEQDMRLITRPLQVLRNSSELIATVRDLQRLEAGRDKMGPIDLCRMLKEVKEAFENPPGRDVRFILDLPDSCTMVASGLLRDAFANIVNNAINHSSGPLTVTISLQSEQVDGRSVARISFEDTGPGVPDDRKEKIFDRAMLGLNKGVSRGLGLHLVRRLVEDHGGRVWVEDRVPGDHTKGARFVIELPIDSTSSGRTERPPETGGPTVGTAVERSGHA